MSEARPGREKRKGKETVFFRKPNTSSRATKKRTPDYGVG
jgi:hypothetical protein